ncbi:hypothetical protein BBJ28_00004587 [Nothophytophthora sp. Chile5]|nr:hypothetical protein BBJ28_00004587 [Nothophytophthora sp. Chile5]
MRVWVECFNRMLSTHDKVFMEAMAVQTLADVRPFLDECDVIGIDEGQFYPDLVEFCQDAANMGKVVVVAALDATFERKVRSVVVCVSFAAARGYRSLLCAMYCRQNLIKYVRVEIFADSTAAGI